MTSPSNATRLAEAVASVAAEVARTGLDVAHISADTYSHHVNGGDRGPTVKVQASTAEDVVTLAAVFPGLPSEPLLYGDDTSAKHAGVWTGMGLVVVVYGPAPERVTA